MHFCNNSYVQKHPHILINVIYYIQYIYKKSKFKIEVNL